MPLTEARQTATRRLLQQLPQLPLKDSRKRYFSSRELAKAMQKPRTLCRLPIPRLRAGKPDVEIAVNTFEAASSRRPEAGPGRDSGGLSRTGQRRLKTWRRTSPPKRSNVSLHSGAVADWHRSDPWERCFHGIASDVGAGGGRRILVGPAWPKNWDVEFKLHAPNNTIAEGLSKQVRWKPEVTPDKRNTCVDPQSAFFESRNVQ